MAAYRKTITIVGAGSVGVNAALMLDKLGFHVVLIDSAPDILQGSAQVSFVQHADGFEYYRDGHQKTGEYCIDGAITKSLLFPSSLFATPICTPERPIRFLVSEEATRRAVDPITIEAFNANAEHMRRHFAKRFAEISTSRGWGDRKTATQLGRTPGSFARPLSAEEIRDCTHIAGGYAGSGGGVNMPYYYAFMKAALNKSNIEQRLSTSVASVEKKGDGYVVHTSEGKTISTDGIAFCCGQGIPTLFNAIPGIKHPPAEGMYYLNAMAFFTLPPTSDKAKLDMLSRINFTLQADEGCMYTCIVPPTTTTPGQATVYFPSEKGTQIRKHAFDSSAQEVPEEWKRIATEGLDKTHPEEYAARVEAIKQQAYHYYPFLSGYAKFEGVRYGSVFNASTPDSQSGKRRNVREIIGNDAITDDGKVIACRAPKWTNAELVAMMTTDHMLKTLMGKNLNTAIRDYLPSSTTKANDDWPGGLDVPRITEWLNFRDPAIRPNPEDAKKYARDSHIHPAIVDENAEIFRSYRSASPRRTKGS